MDSYEGGGGDPMSLHKYLYSHANPVNGIDPTGHAVYFVTRRFNSPGSGSWIAWKAKVGHGYLLFTVPGDDGTNGDPSASGFGAITTFSWHPFSWDYANGPGGYDYSTCARGRVWERHTDDMSPKDCSFYLVTGNPAQQAALLQGIRNWIQRYGPGYDRGAPIPDLPDNPQNDRGTAQHDRPSRNSPYYNLMEQNCVWWATIMIMQHNITLSKDLQDAILKFNRGHSAAKDVIQGRRRPTTVHRMNDLLFNMTLPGADSVIVASLF